MKIEGGKFIPTDEDYILTISEKIAENFDTLVSDDVDKEDHLRSIIVSQILKATTENFKVYINKLNVDLFNKTMFRQYLSKYETILDIMVDDIDDVPSYIIELQDTSPLRMEVRQVTNQFLENVKEIQSEGCNILWFMTSDDRRFRMEREKAGKNEGHSGFNHFGLCEKMNEVFDKNFYEGERLRVNQPA